jgi:hypothetical protein
MATALDRSIRKILEKAITGKDGAREIAEDGARKALTELGVEDARRPDGLTRDQTDLRNRLRAHARSLGDPMQSDGSIKANRLVREIAYEHWHRALFARFLAESNLLIDPEFKVPVSLTQLEEVAKEEGRDLVELAADWAEPMLPQIFRKGDPVLALTMPPETKAGVVEIVKGLPPAVFAADDSLGWIYQFWQADQKEQINESEVKVGADELPAVTQLFTEDYMVQFLLENTLGAWWAGKVLAADPALAASAGSEEELRERTSLPGYRWTYLRFVREPRESETYGNATGSWRPAAGVFEGWPQAAKEVTVLDPCMGSGHFLVFALPILMAFRRAEEGLDERAAVKAVLAENLFGLEIDPRCTQIAAFALALASWKRLGGPEPLPRLNLACSGLAIGLGKVEFLKLAEKIAFKRGWKPTTDLLGDGATPFEGAAIKREREGLSRLYDLFVLAPVLGSLINPRRTGSDLFAAGFDDLAELLGEVLEAGETNLETRETAIAAQGLATAAKLLSRTYTLAATNVPYLGRGKQSSELKGFLEQHYASAKNDLAFALLRRFLDLLNVGGTTCVVTPSNWTTIRSYKSFRRELLATGDVALLYHVGKSAFQDMNWWALPIGLYVFSNTVGNRVYAAIECASDHRFSQKPIVARSGPIELVAKQSVLNTDAARVRFSRMEAYSSLDEYCSSQQGITTGDTNKFGRAFWEIEKAEGYRFWQSTVEGTSPYSGRHRAVLWNRGGVAIEQEQGATLRGAATWGTKGILVNLMGKLPVTVSDGEINDDNSTRLIPSSDAYLAALWAYCSSDEFNEAVRRVDDSPKVMPNTVLDAEFDFAHWREVAAERFPNGLPKPSSNDPTQWLFDGHPRGSANQNFTPNSNTNPRLVTPHGVRPGMAEHPLQVVVARLLGYRWPRQVGSSFMDSPAVPDPDEVDRSGLVDTDGIVPLPALAGEADAATRLRDLIRVVWGPDYAEDTIRKLLAAEEAKTADLNTWLADEFFDDHCRLFHQTPFIWHIWDGVRGGFSAFINYHRLCEGNGAGRRLLEKLRDSYLGEWIATQRRALAAGEAGAEERLIAAEYLRGELTKIIEGNPPYDIFVRWKPLFRQAIGWEPDIDDGVRLNIRPFLTAKPKNSGRRDGCILRFTPRVKKHAGADRGTDPHREKEEFPWFWAEDHDVETEDFAGGPQFKGRRYNDFHYTREIKRNAREAKARAVSGALSEPVLEKQGRAS